MIFAELLQPALARPGPAPGGGSAGEIDRSSVRAALAALSPRPRRVLAGLADLGLTEEEIARYVGASPEAIAYLMRSWKPGGSAGNGLP